MQQGSAEWHAARTGKITASRLHDVAGRTAKDKPYAAHEKYHYELVQERLTGQAAEHFVSGPMEHGTLTEPEAAATYEMMYGVKLDKVGFVDHPTIPNAGASPDRLIGTDGLWEAKCPNSGTHLATLLGEPIKPQYIYQMQWQLACTQREWCDFHSYDGRFENPALQSKIIRIERDDDLIAQMEKAAREFEARVTEAVARLNSLGQTKAAA